MIPQNEFTEEVATDIEIFLKAQAANDWSETFRRQQAMQCAKLITSLARATTFDPFLDDVVCHESAVTADQVKQLINKMDGNQ